LDIIKQTRYKRKKDKLDKARKKLKDQHDIKIRGMAALGKGDSPYKCTSTNLKHMVHW
jgi:hypothetical protein